MSLIEVSSLTGMPGFECRRVYPQDSLDDGDRQRIRMLAMPDCNTTQMGDCFYCFRTRKSHRLPLLSSSLLEQTFEYCYAFFRQEKNNECARGMFQKSVVLVSRYPYVNLYERLVKVIGPLYFAHGPAVLEAVFASVEEWPAPCPGALCPLPFLSETIMFQVPEIDMPPQVASKYRYHRGTRTCSLWPRERIRGLSRTMSGCGSSDFASSSSNPSSRTLGDGFSAAYVPGTGSDGDTLMDDPTAASEEQTPAGDTMGPLGVERRASELWHGSGATSFVDVNRNTSDHCGRERNPGMIGKSCESGVLSSSNSTDQGRTDVDLCPGDGAFVDECLSEHGTEAVVSIWKREDENMDCEKLGGNGDGEAEVSRCSVWSGTARSPGVLVTPGLRRQTGGLGGDSDGTGDEKSLADRVSAQRRSSLGSRSLASVVSNSPSESWLTTPKNAGSPLMVLDSNCGSNLAQSCYYVADRDSEDDDEISIPEDGEEEGDLDNGDRAAGAVATDGHFMFERWRYNSERSGEVDASSQQGGNQETKESIAPSGSPLVTVGSPRKAAACRDQSPVRKGPRCHALVENPVDSVTGVSNRLNPQVARTVIRTKNEASLAVTSPSVSEQCHATDNHRAGECRMDPELHQESSPTELAQSTSDVQDRGPGGPTNMSPIHHSAAPREDSILPPPSPEASSKLWGVKPEGSLILKASAASLVPPTLTPGGGYSKCSEWAGLRAWAESAPGNPLDAPPPLSSPLVTRSRSTNNSPSGGKLVRVDPSSPKRGATAGVPESDLVSAPTSVQVLSPGRRGKDPGVKATDDVAVSSVGVSKTELAAEEDGGEKGMQAPKFSSHFSSVTHPPAGTDNETCQHVSPGMHVGKETTREGEDQRQGDGLSSLRSSPPTKLSRERVGDSFARDAGRGLQTPNGEDISQAAGGVLELVGDGGRTASISPKSRIGFLKSSPTRVSGSRRHRQGARTSRAAGDAVGVYDITSTLGKCSVNVVHNKSAGHVLSPRACAREARSDKNRIVPVGIDADHGPSPFADAENSASGFHVGRGKIEADRGDLTPGSMVADSKDEKATVVASRRASKSDGRPPSFRKKSFRISTDQRSLPRKGKQDKRSIHIHRTASTLQGGRSPFAEMLLADEARFRAKQGLFQSIGLYSIFGRKLVEHLWLLWELVLTGGPTLVVGSNVGASSAAILGMVSLASPVFFGGDFRPHFTTFDPDYRDIVAAHDRLTKHQPWGSSVLGVPGAGSGTDATGGFPSILLGVINPIFLRTLSRWPNAIVLPGAAGRSQGPNTSSERNDASASRKHQKRLSEDSIPESPRNRHCPTPKMEATPPSRPPPVRVQVIRGGASLDQVVGQDERPEEPIIVCRQQPVMLPDAGVLSRLLDPSCPYNPVTAAAAAAEAAAAEKIVPEGLSAPPTPSSAGIAAMAAKAAAAAKGGLETRGQWKDSLRAINDVILRRHFAHLTRSFLSPFDKYFRPSRAPPHLTPWQQQALARLSVYTEAELLLSKFDEEEFLSEMAVVGPPKSFAHVQWQTLYRRFMESPNFRPWFTTQRIEGIERIREFNRAVSLRTTAAALVEACAPVKLPMLLAKIKRAIAREWGLQPSEVDWELLERMEMHQAAVEAAVSTLSSSAPAGSAQP